MYASKVVAYLILSLGLLVMPLVWLYLRGVRLVLSWVISGSVRSCEYVRPRMLLWCGVRLRVVIC